MIIKSNLTFEEHHTWIAKSVTFTMCWPLQLDFFDQPKYLMPNVNLHLRLKPNNVDYLKWSIYIEIKNQSHKRWSTVREIWILRVNHNVIGEGVRQSNIHVWIHHWNIHSNILKSEIWSEYPKIRSKSIIFFLIRKNSKYISN